MLKIKIILASVREGRFGDKVAKWVLDMVSENKNVEAEILDLKEYQLPMFAEPVSPMYIQGEYRTPEINRWAQKIADADGFIIVTPEYNHGYPASLKNNLDYLFKEWNKKPVTFVAYGSAGGARSVEQLKQVVVQLQMVPARNAVHILNPWLLTNEDGSLKAGVLDGYVDPAKHMLEEIVWLTEALKNARQK